MGQLDLWLAVRGVAAAKEVIVGGRRRPAGPAAALLDAVRLPGVQRGCVCDAWKADRAGEIDLNLQLIYPLTTNSGLIGTW